MCERAGPVYNITSPPPEKSAKVRLKPDTPYRTATDGT